MLVGREEAADVPRGLGAELGRDPAGQGPQLAVVVVVARDDEGRDLDPDARRAVGPQCVEDGGQARAAELAVEGVVERLEVDVGGIEDRPQEVDRLGRGVAVGDEDVEEPGRLRLPCRVERVLQEDRRLDVRVGDRPRPRGERLVDRLGGGSWRVGRSRPRRGAWAISQFWQKTQWNGQPTVAIE